MMPATGGTIIQVSHFDSKVGEHVYDTYVITDDNDIGNEINKILVQYRLKNG